MSRQCSESTLSHPAPLLTKHDVAARLNINPRTVLKLAARRAIASVRVGQSIRFEPAAVEAFIEANRRTVAAAPAQPIPPPLHTLPRPRKDYFA